MSATYTTPSLAISSQNLSLAEERNDLEIFIWETYRDIHGIKPRWYEFSKWTIQELRNEADSLGEAVAREYAAKEQIKKDKIARANAKAHAARVFDSKFNSLSFLLR